MELVFLFERIVERIFTAAIQLKTTQLNAAIDKLPKCDVVFIAGDFSIKTGSHQNENLNSSIEATNKKRYKIYSFG